jgi:hypothetical protein
MASELEERKESASDYSTGVIYMGRCPADPRVYFGSTRGFAQRRAHHVWKALTNDSSAQSKLYQAMRLYGPETFTFEIIEKWPCSSRLELARREFQWIQGAPDSILYNTELEMGTRSDETKAKLAQAWTPEKRAEMRQWNEEYWTPERRAAHGERVRAALNNDETRAKRPDRRGSKNPNFKGGTIFNDVNKKRWRVRLAGKEEGFGYGPRSGRTEAEAKALAEAYKASLVAAE